MSMATLAGSRHFAALMIVVAFISFTTSNPASAGTIPVQADVGGSGLADIGELDVQPDNANGGMNIDFNLDEDFAFLDEWYDFQWVQIVVGYTVNGVSVTPVPLWGTLPAIDPAIGQNVPGALPDPDGDGIGQGDDKPYYYNDDNWDDGVFGPDTIHTEGEGSRFVDYRADWPAGAVITFRTFLVAESITDPAIDGREFCLLGGIEWTYTQNGPAIEWTASLLAVQGNADDINDAMDNPNSPFGANWDAQVGCDLTECPFIWDCVFSSIPGVTFSKSDWTHNGKTIGTTFDDGVTPLPGIPVYDGTYLPTVPNDWHFTITIPCPGGPLIFDVAITDFGPDDHVSVDILCSKAPIPGLNLFVDVGNDFYLLSLPDGPPIWQGLWSQYPNDIPPNLGLVPTGTVRNNFLLPPIGPIISEIRVDEPSTDNNEYLEIKGPPGMNLNGLTYLVIGDNVAAQASGVIEAVVPLLGTIPPTGYYVVAEPSFTLGLPDQVSTLNFENDDNVTHLLVANFNGNLNQDLDGDNNGVLDITPWQQALDLIALVKSPNPPVGTEFHYGPPAIGPDATFPPSHVYRCEPLGVWKLGEFDLALVTDTPRQPNLPCSPPILVAGACCVGNGDCLQTSAALCALGGGVYAGDNTNCTVIECVISCTQDITGDGVIDVDDLVFLINSWGPCVNPGDCLADIVPPGGDGMVNVDDLVAIINAWGPCK